MEVEIVFFALINSINFYNIRCLFVDNCHLVLFFFYQKPSCLMQLKDFSAITISQQPWSACRITRAALILPLLQVPELSCLNILNLKLKDSLEKSIRHLIGIAVTKWSHEVMKLSILLSMCIVFAFYYQVLNKNGLFIVHSYGRNMVFSPCLTHHPLYSSTVPALYGNLKQPRYRPTFKKLYHYLLQH